MADHSFAHKVVRGYMPTVQEQVSTRLGYLLSQEPSSQAWILVRALTLCYFIYCLGLVVYRLTLHPLARFPGPFLCKIGYLKQCYYEAFLNGMFVHQIADYHKKYGPVVRINPNEVHIDDPSVYHEIFAQKSQFAKDPVSYSLGVTQALAFTMDIETHRIRRQVLDPSYSKRRVNSMEDTIYDELERVFAKISEYAELGNNSIVPIAELFFCFTGDIISLYLFGESLDLISRPDFMERAEQMRSFTKGAWFSMHFPFVRTLMLKAPHWILALVNNAWVNVFIFCEDLAKQAIAQFDEEQKAKKGAAAAVPASESDKESIFNRLLNANLRRQEKGKKSGKPLNFHELADEGISSLNAGTEPTATMLTYATYFFLRYPEVQGRVMEELAAVKPDDKGRLPLQQVEQLPYFTGFVKESLRFMVLVPGRLPRVVPKGGLYVPAAKATIPEGTVVGMSHFALHNNPDIFENPAKFAPERWLGPEGKQLNHWLLSFSKGRTDCIGKNLAYAEMHLMLANLFTRFYLELTPGSIDGMQWLDRVIVHPKKNLRIKVRARETKQAV